MDSEFGVYLKFRNNIGVNVKVWISAKHKTFGVSEAFMYDHDIRKALLTPKQGAEFCKSEFERVWDLLDKAEKPDLMRERIDETKVIMRNSGYAFISESVAI